MEHLPFCVFKRAGRAFYYVKFKNLSGAYAPAVSTKQTSKAAAIATAYEWLRNGKPVALGGNIAVITLDVLKQIQTMGEADFVCRELQRKGLLRSFVVAESRQDVDFPAYLLNFWDYEMSPYVKEKLRKRHGIHKNYTVGQRLVVEKYWKPFFQGWLLGEITWQDIEKFIDAISMRKISSGRKNIVLKAGTIPLRWAFSKEAIEKDVTQGITWFSGEARERQILTPEIVEALFRVEWRDERARLANMLAAVTWLRAGEICGLQIGDLCDDCISIRHSWNCRDGLKTTKTNEPRMVELPFPDIMQDLRLLAESNPHGANVNSYVFWAAQSSLKPMDNVLLVRGLRDALEKTGMGHDAALKYVFHGWRHFFTSYMRERLDVKLLQSQTGHKNVSMIDHYSRHRLIGDREKIRQAGIEVFGALLPKSQLKDLS
jgi:integrase